MKTNEQLDTLALDILNDKVFTDRHLEDKDIEMMPSIFPAITLMAQDDRIEFLKDFGMLYAYVKEAGPMSMNGYPVFFSVNKLTVEEAAYVSRRYVALKAAQAAVLAQPVKKEDLTEKAPEVQSDSNGA